MEKTICIWVIILWSALFAFADNGTSGYVTIPYDNNTTSYYDDIFPSDNNTMNYYGTYTIPWKDLIPNNCTMGTSIGVQINSGVLFYELEATNKKSFKELTRNLLKKIGCPVSLKFAVVTKNGRINSNKSLAMVKWATKTIVHHNMI